MLEALRKELQLRHNEQTDKNLKTLYFGGGTPSLLTGDEVKMLVGEVAQYFDFAPDIEMTLEANPDDLSAVFLREIREAGINRLSIGTQSFHEADLRLMNRAHTAGEAEDSIKRAQDIGLTNISIDLIYGSSGMEVWKQNLQKTIALEVPHVSSYALTVEPKTVLAHWVDTNKVAAPSEDLQNEQFHYLSDFLKDNSFEHYEISNFAKLGYHSRHNSAYWEGKPYLGIGPSAHSYNGAEIRSWNVANNSLYIKSLAEGKRPAETELLSEKDRYNELLMIGLRTQKGTDVNKIKTDLGDEFFSRLLTDAREKLNDGFLVLENNHLKIPEKHWFLADGIASDLFL